MSDILTIVCSHCEDIIEVERDQIVLAEGASLDDPTVKYLCEDCYLLYTELPNVLPTSTELH